MKKGFTLLELIVVIIVLGILATLALTQYSKTIERSRGAEARAIIGGLRKMAAAGYMGAGTVAGFSDQALLGIGLSNDQAPSSCRQSHYFTYGSVQSGTAGITFVATRCTTGGKTPQYTAANTLFLISALDTGIENWTSAGQY